MAVGAEEFADSYIDERDDNLEEDDSEDENNNDKTLKDITSYKWSDEK